MNDETEVRYCEECGCEILSDEDVGFESAEETERMHISGIPAAGHGTFERPIVYCRACAEENMREWVGFRRTPEGQSECSTFSTDGNLR